MMRIVVEYIPTYLWHWHIHSYMHRYHNNGTTIIIVMGLLVAEGDALVRTTLTGMGNSLLSCQTYIYVICRSVTYTIPE